MILVPMAPKVLARSNAVRKDWKILFVVATERSAMSLGGRSRPGRVKKQGSRARRDRREMKWVSRLFVVEEWDGVLAGLLRDRQGDAERSLLVRTAWWIQKRSYNRMGHGEVWGWI
jgi:hypothetical protein